MSSILSPIPTYWRVCFKNLQPTLSKAFSAFVESNSMESGVTEVDKIKGPAGVVPCFFVRNKPSLVTMYDLCGKWEQKYAGLFAKKFRLVFNNEISVPSFLRLI